MTSPQYKPVTTPAMAAPVNLTGQETRSSDARSESRTPLAGRYCLDSFQPRSQKSSVATSWDYPDTMYSQYQYSPPQSRQTNTLPYPWVDDGEILSVLQTMVLIDTAASLVQKGPHELHDSNSFDTGSSNFEQETFSTDGDDPINLSSYSAQDLSACPFNLKRNVTRRSSLSTFSISSTDPITEALGPSSLSDLPLHLADYTIGLSNQSSTNLATPIQVTNGSQQYRVRTGSHSRASPASRPSYRTTPYSSDGVPSKPWSSVSCPTIPSRRNSPLGNQIWEGSQFQFSHPAPYNPSFALPMSNIASSDDPLIKQRLVTTSTSCLHHDSTALLSSYQSSLSNSQAASSSSPQDFLNNVQSTLNSQEIYANHYSHFSDPPDLFAPLLDEQESPPPEDMKPSDPDLIPREQDLRFEVDLYTPRWVRGHGNKREGWCGICKPGRWLVLKNSAFWYDKSFSHGVSAATGTAFEGPQKTRCAEGTPDVWEGLCTSCGGWIALISSKKKGTTWFRHAYKVDYLNDRKYKDGVKADHP